MNISNLAQKSNFIAGSPQFKNVPFFITYLNIPGVSISHPEISGGRQGSRLHLSGDSITFNTLSFEMLIDEDFIIYKEIMDIILKNINPIDGTFNDFTFNFFIEITNNKGNKVLKLEFFNCRISSISDIQLNTNDESTENTLSMELVYDYYTIESLKRYNIIQSIPQKINSDSTWKYFSDNFETISNDWVLWGYPLPIIVQDDEATNGKGLDSNGTGIYGSGAVLNALPLNIMMPFEVIFRVKQPLGENDNGSYFLDFGITEGFGLPNTTNGRTGNTVVGILVDGGHYDLNSELTPYGIYYNVLGNFNKFDNNDGMFHEFKITFEPFENTCTYKIYKDNELKAEFNELLPLHDELFVYIQGKSENGVQLVDFVKVKYK